VGDALLRPGFDDDAGLATGDHAGDEDLGTVDHAPEIDAEHPLPVRRRPEDPASGLHAGIVHEHVDGPELVEHRSFQAAQLVHVGHVRPDRQDGLGAAGGECPLLGCGRLQPFGIVVGQADPKPQRGEAPGGRETDTGGAARNYGDIVRSKSLDRHGLSHTAGVGNGVRPERIRRPAELSPGGRFSSSTTSSVPAVQRPAVFSLC